MISRQHGEGSVDLVAVARDDKLLDLLGARVGVDVTQDRVTALLDALVSEVDGELATVLSEPFPELPELPEAPLQLTAAPRGGRAGRRAAVALIVGATLSVGGVSAAVTGDPLAAARSVVSAFDVGKELPPTAAEIARWNKRLVAVRAAVRRGDAGAASAITALEREIDSLDLRPGQRDALLRKLDRLRARLGDDAKPAKDQDRRLPGTTKPTPRGGKPPGVGPPAGRADTKPEKTSNGSRNQEPEQRLTRKPLRQERSGPVSTTTDDSQSGVQGAGPR